MTTLNPTGSAQRMLDVGTNIRGYCLVAVGNAVLQGEPVLAHAATAAAAYTDAGSAHQHATHAPADFPMFFTGAGGSGDVVLSVGDGVHCVASDYTVAGVTHWGRIGTMTLADRERQVGGHLLGWTDRFLGYDLVGTNDAGTGTVTPVTDPTKTKEDDMPNVWQRLDGTVRTWALFDAYRWQETQDAVLAGQWCQLYLQGNSATDITDPKNTSGGAQVTAWNTRSNDPHRVPNFFPTASSGVAIDYTKVASPQDVAAVTTALETKLAKGTVTFP